MSGVKKVFADGMRVIKPGGYYSFVGLVHPNSQLDVTAEQIIRKCLTFRGMAFENFFEGFIYYKLKLWVSNGLSPQPRTHVEAKCPGYEVGYAGYRVKLSLI